MTSGAENLRLDTIAVDVGTVRCGVAILLTGGLRRSVRSVQLATLAPEAVREVFLELKPFKPRVVLVEHPGFNEPGSEAARSLKAILSAARRVTPLMFDAPRVTWQKQAFGGHRLSKAVQQNHAVAELAKLVPDAEALWKAASRDERAALAMLACWHPPLARGRGKPVVSGVLEPSKPLESLSRSAQALYNVRVSMADTGSRAGADRQRKAAHLNLANYWRALDELVAAGWVDEQPTVSVIHAAGEEEEAAEDFYEPPAPPDEVEWDEARARRRRAEEAAKTPEQKAQEQQERRQRIQAIRGEKAAKEARSRQFAEEIHKRWRRELAELDKKEQAATTLEEKGDIAAQRRALRLLLGGE